jgi:VanZ family protein
MKKLAILIALVCMPLMGFAQNFDSFEDEKDVTSVIVTKNMFKLLSKIDLESNDPEAQEYMDLVNNLENIKIYTTENPEVAGRMNSAVANYVSKSKALSELMRVKDDGKNIKFYSKEGKNENFVSELLMHLDGNVDGKKMTVIMSITGNIDLKKISKLTQDLKVPGSEELKNIDKKKKS